MGDKIFVSISGFFMLLPFVFYIITFFNKAEIFIYLVFISFGIAVIFMLITIGVIIVRKKENKLLMNLKDYYEKKDN